MDPWQIVAVLATALTTVVTTIGAAILSGRLVPGHVYQREVARADQATTDAAENKALLKEVVRLLRRKSDAAAG